MSKGIYPHGPLTKEHRKKISETLLRIGHKPAPMYGDKNPSKRIDVRLKISNSKKGKRQSEVTRQKISFYRKGRLLSEEHKRKIGLSSIGRKHSESFKNKMRGSLNPNWIDGRTPENHKIRNSIEIALWRNSVFARDGYIDQKTGIKGWELEAHHVLNFSQYPELRLAIDNGITLSKKSHKEFHKKYGKQNNTREQLDEFLLNQT